MPAGPREPRLGTARRLEYRIERTGGAEMPDGSGERWRETKRAWDEVARRFSEVGRKVGEQYQKLGDEAPRSAEPTGAKVGDAVRDAVEELDRALTSVGDALRDPEAKESLRQAVSSFGGALEATFTEVGEELKKQFGSKLPPSS
jgi:hypothetical protein